LAPLFVIRRRSYLILTTLAMPLIRWFGALCEKEPQVVFACMLGAIGILLPVTVVPMRRRMGFDTSQYDGVPAAQ